MRRNRILWAACALLLIACAADRTDLRKREVAYRDLGKQYYLAGDFTSALKYLLEAEQMYPDDHILQNYLGQVYLAKGKPELAVNTLQTGFAAETRLCGCQKQPRGCLPE